MKRYLALILVLSTICTNLFSAEAGMPQLDPKYWASQTFWLILVFSTLYISIAKFFLPKIKKNLDDRENKIEEDLDEANKLKELSEKKLKEYKLILDEGKKEVARILMDSKNKLRSDIQNKKSAVEKEIEQELAGAQKEIIQFKKDSINSINNIAEEIAANLIEKTFGDKLNQSSIKATVEDITKKNVGNYL